VSNYTFPVSAIIFDQVTNENVDIAGFIHVQTTLTFTNSGDFLSTFTNVADDTSANGERTGAAYALTLTSEPPTIPVAHFNSMRIAMDIRPPDPRDVCQTCEGTLACCISDNGIDFRCAVCPKCKPNDKSPVCNFALLGLDLNLSISSLGELDANQSQVTVEPCAVASPPSGCTECCDPTTRDCCPSFGTTLG
jgi:hypothetical protein